MSSFGWIPPTPQKQADNDRYPLWMLDLEVPATIEKVLTYPNYVGHYNQQNNGCTGFSASWMSSINNGPKYDANWLYWEGRKEAGLPPNRDEGGYIWAVMDVLRKKGHKEPGGSVKADAGIERFYWSKTVDDVRSALEINRPPVFGFFWYEEFMSPRTLNGERWIGTRSSWGSIVGGHAICCIGASDQRQGFMLLNSWGSEYPPVWIGYTSIIRLLSQQGECAVAVDIGAPEPPPSNQEWTLKMPDGTKYRGVLGVRT